MAGALEAFRAGGRGALPVALLVRDAPLARAVQDRLAHHGLLDPPSDGFLGPVGQWALREFCRARGLPFDGALTREAADALLADAPALPLEPGDDLAGRVVAALLRRGAWVCRHPDALTIAYVEGMDPEGRPTPRRPDAFDDARLLLRTAPGGRPLLAGAWEATTAPGRPAVEEPAEPAGAPRIARGQHKAWAMGRTAIGTELEQDALVQVAPLAATRDGNRDFRREGDSAETGLFVLDQHGAMDAPRERVGGVGAGCLLGRAQDGHRAFVALLRGDARFRACAAYRFMAAVVGWRGGCLRTPRRAVPFGGPIRWNDRADAGHPGCSRSEAGVGTWRASAARGRLADIIEHAAAGRPQFIRRRDGREVVVVSREYSDRTQADVMSYLLANGYSGECEEEFDRIMEGIRGDTAGSFAPRVPPPENL